jgi:hypothetical protein
VIGSEATERYPKLTANSIKQAYSGVGPEVVTQKMLDRLQKTRGIGMQTKLMEALPSSYQQLLRQALVVSSDSDAQKKVKFKQFQSPEHGPCKYMVVRGDAHSKVGGLPSWFQNSKWPVTSAFFSPPYGMNRFPAENGVDDKTPITQGNLETCLSKLLIHSDVSCVLPLL